MKPNLRPSAESADQTAYARGEGYTGKKRVLVSDGKVISHRNQDWFEFCDDCRVADLQKRINTLARRGPKTMLVKVYCGHRKPVMVRAHGQDDAGDIVGQASRMKQLTVELSNVGNPDHRQDPTRPVYGTENRTFTVYHLKDAVKACRDYITEFDLGGGNWTGGKVTNNTGEVVGYISYNGRIWANKHWTPQTKEIIP